MVKAKCEVIDCCNEKSTTVSLHTIPKDEHQSKRWLSFLNLANQKYNNWKPTKKVIVVCSNHFTPNDFRYGLSGKRFVLFDHFPTLLDGIDLSLEVINNCSERTSQVQVIQAISENKEVLTYPQFLDSSCQTDLDDALLKCENIIQKQKDCIKIQFDRIQFLEKTVSSLKADICNLKNKTIKQLSLRCQRQEESAKRKSEEIDLLRLNMKKLKKEWVLPGDCTPADKILLEMIQRRHAAKGEPYSDVMREFAFNAHYISPKGYSYLREQLPNVLPDKSNCIRWTKDVCAYPGLLQISMQDIKRSSQEKCMYYALSFDEMALRQQVIFDGEKMQGRCDYGVLSKQTPPTTLAKSALFCLATEVNGSKCFPIAYALTDGLPAKVLSEVMRNCVDAIESFNGNVLSVSFDGLKANFNAVEMLGANLKITDPEFQPFFESQSKSKHYLMPDCCHMMKLVRNTLDKCKVLFNSDGEAIKWSYIQKLLEVQEKEKLRAANKLTSRHLNFHQKKMNVKLCVQLLSEGTASGIDFCRSIQIPGFESSEATTEFLRVNNYTFDLLNTRSYGTGTNAALNKWNKLNWSLLITTSKAYYTGLQIMVANKLVPLHCTKYGTCIRGILTALTSVELIMKDVEKDEIGLKYLPTYRLSQDPLELYFSGLRRRFGCNDNPNAVQLTYAIRAMLCFKLQANIRGNCVEQEDLFHALPKCTDANEDHAELDSEDSDDYFKNDIDIESYIRLSPFVDNVSVYISGFVGKKLYASLKCDHCKASLSSQDAESNRLREDFLLLRQKDRGGLFKPSDDLIAVCKITERIIRLEETKGVFKLSSKKIETMVKRDCAERPIFSTLHVGYSSSVLKIAAHIIHTTHRLFLISEICKVYVKTRLNYIARSSSLKAKPITNRSKCNKLIHFSGC